MHTDNDKSLTSDKKKKFGIVFIRQTDVRRFTFNFDRTFTRAVRRKTEIYNS